MTTVYSSDNLQLYSIRIEKDLHMQPVQRNERPTTQSHGRSRETSTVIVIHDSGSNLPSLKNPGTKSELPSLKQLSSLKNVAVEGLAASPRNIFTVLPDNSLCTSDEIPGAYPGSQLKFTTLACPKNGRILNISSGAEHVVGVAVNATRSFVFGIGSNVAGQLGLGNIEKAASFQHIAMPVRERCVLVCCGWAFTLVLTETGSVLGFGQNSRGQLGLGARTECVWVPTYCRPLKGVPVCALACGSSHSLAVSSMGLVYVCGSNEQGQLGLDAPSDCVEFTLLQKMVNVFVVKVAAFGCYSAAIDEHGTLYLWGGKHGAEPKTFVFAPHEKFIDVALGTEGRVVGLTRNLGLFVSGYRANGVTVSTPLKIHSPEFPLWKVISGGEYFVVLADRSKEIPFASINYGTEGTLLPPAPSRIRHRLRPPRRILTLASGHFPDVLNNTAAGQILASVFGSVGSLNASFLMENFYEASSDVSSGTDVRGVTSAFNYLMERKDAMNIVTNSLNALMADLWNEPLKIRRPSMMRFLFIAALHPSPLVFGQGITFWKNFIEVMAALKVHNLFAQWLSVIAESDLKRVLNSFKDCLTIVIRSSNDLYSWYIVEVVNVLACIHAAATRTKKLTFEDFYHNALNESVNVDIDYKRWQQDGCWCFTRNAPWLLNADAKTRFLRADAKDRQMRAQMTYFMRSLRRRHGLIVNLDEFFLNLEVNRERILADTERALRKLNQPELALRMPLSVSFEGEPAVDGGGVQREYFELIIKELFDSGKGLFTNNKDVFWFNPQATDARSLQQYQLTGILFGLAVNNGNLINVRFPLVLYKKLRGLNVCMQDLEDLDAAVFSSLNSILKYKGDVENDMCLVFEYNGVPLCSNGLETPVTNGNREQYVEAVTKHILQDSIQKQFAAFKNGFIVAVGDICINIFRPEEMALLVAGREQLDFHELERAATYEIYTPSSPAVRTFWKIVHTRLTDEEKRKLLYFITSSPRAPINGLGAVPLVITRDANPSHIPTSHTCFSMLVLPDNPNEESMYQKLKVAIDNSEGFAFK